MVTKCVSEFIYCIFFLCESERENIELKKKWLYFSSLRLLKFHYCIWRTITRHCKRWICAPLSIRRAKKPFSKVFNVYYTHNHTHCVVSRSARKLYRKKKSIRTVGNASSNAKNLIYIRGRSTHKIHIEIDRQRKKTTSIEPKAKKHTHTHQHKNGIYRAAVALANNIDLYIHSLNYIVLYWIVYWPYEHFKMHAFSIGIHHENENSPWIIVTFNLNYV